MLKRRYPATVMLKGFLIAFKTLYVVSLLIRGGKKRVIRFKIK